MMFISLMVISVGSAGSSRQITVSEVRTAVLLVRTTHGVSAQGTTAPVTVLREGEGTISLFLDSSEFFKGNKGPKMPPKRFALKV